jgi:hypothetical protein
MSQNARIKSYLKQGKRLTSLSGLRDLGIIDVPKRMSELDQQGFEFKKHWIEVPTRFDGKTRVMEYYL